MSIPNTSRESLGVAIGRRVHHLMWEERVTQKSLAPLIGVDQPGLGRRLRGETGWSPDELAATARELRTTVAYLFGEVDDVEWAPSGSNRRPADYKYAGSDALVTPIDWIFERRQLVAS